MSLNKNIFIPFRKLLSCYLKLSGRCLPVEFYWEFPLYAASGTEQTRDVPHQVRV